MTVKEYQSSNELHRVYKECTEAKKSDLWDSGASISFRVYNQIGNTKVLHIFKYRI